MTFDSWKYHPDNLPDYDQGQNRNRYLKAIEDEMAGKLERGELPPDFFSGYTPNALGQFLTEYGRARASAALNASQYIREIEALPEMRYRPETAAIYDLILQKKLFNLQCLWRAEQADIPGLWMTLHFRYWGEHIRECPFLEPVTSAEIGAMQAFLLDNNFEDTTRWWLHTWQDYDEFLEEDERGFHYKMPEWYDYYDSHLATHYLLQLPDIRGGRELHYRKIAAAESRRKHAEKAAADAAAGIVPARYVKGPDTYIYNTPQNFYDFARKYDDPYFAAIFRHLRDEAQRRQEQAQGYDVEDYIRTLEDAPVPPYIQGGCNWREALKRTAQQYKNSIIAEDLELYHAEYALMQDITPRPSVEEMGKRYEEDPLIGMVSGYVMEGRRLSGEGEDWDF